jgi:hypothetical protein
MSHFAMIFFISLSSSALAKSWMMQLKACPSWSRAPFGAILIVVSFTKRRMPPLLSHSLKERSEINLRLLDLWGIAAIGEIFSRLGGLSLIEFQSTTVAWPTATLSAASLVKCCNASWDSADLCSLHL